MKSPIFGPQEVSSVEGGSASITCYYPATSVNRHTRKYWCRQGAKGRCTTLISSEGYISKDYEGRAKLTNFPENSTFVVNIGHLTRNDSGRYKCGLGISSRGLNFDVSLEVGQGKNLGSLGSFGKVRGAHVGSNWRASGRISSEGSASGLGWEGCVSSFQRQGLYIIEHGNETYRTYLGVVGGLFRSSRPIIF